MHATSESSAKAGWSIPWSPHRERRQLPANPAVIEEAKQETARLRRLRRLARFADTAIRVPGTGIRFGADSLVGLVPGIGDGLMAALSLYIIYEASQHGIPKKTLVRMLLNVGIDVGLGSVPLIGDVFDVFFKANKRNVQLLESELRKSPR